VNDKKNILFTATFVTPFIQTDRSILQHHHYVTEVISSGVLTFFHYLRHFPKTDITFSWFASVYSSILIFLANLFGKRSVLILGGVDVAKLPEVNYGIWNSRWKSAFVRYGITHADVVLAVDPSIKEEAIALAMYDGENISVVPTGHDLDFWRPGTTSRKNIILTVATCDTETRFRIKGIDFLYDIARAFPEQSFVLVGMTDTIRQKTHPPPNISIHPYLSHKELLQYYQTTTVYLQPSMREALGSTLCEAMLCECYPVGTTVGGIPTVIGETGSLIPYSDVQAAVHALKQGLSHGVSKIARQRIIDHFSLQQRETALLRTISSLYGSE